MQIPGSRTLGPVTDLERHLPEDWWKHLFTSLYLKTDGDVVENDSNTKVDIDLLLKATGILPKHKILDLCCGQGRHSLELARRGYSYVSGVDRSRYLIRLARRRVQAAGYAIQFSEGDARHLRLARDSFDVVCLLGNSFGYFEKQSDDIAVIESIKHVLKPTDGKIVLDITDGAWMREHFEKRSWEWIDRDHFVCRERSLSNDGSRIISREVIVHAEKGILADQFYAERLYDEAHIKVLLNHCGFSDITIHLPVVSLSTRDQDLGMMAHRLLITAVAPAKPIKQTSDPSRKAILVLLGDPRLTDPERPETQFTENDLEALQRLKKALGELSQYQFRYLDNHQELLPSLTKTKPEFILNFCDDGFENQPEQELHIPALLEMLGIPYYGTAPQCLGLCYNKSYTRAIAQSMGIFVPEEVYVESSDHAAGIPTIFPALLKPVCGDGSVGITNEAVVYDAQALISHMATLKKLVPDTPVLIQEFLEGSEYSVAIIGNHGDYTILPILEVDYSMLPKDLPKILSYASKWDPSSPYWKDIRYIEAKITEEQRRYLIDSATQLFERVGCRDVARFDFRADQQGAIKLLEINPNPSWCFDGKLAIMANIAGWTYVDLLNRLITTALERYNGMREQA